MLLYVWGSRLPAHEIEACTDRLCGLRVVLSDSRAHMFSVQSVSVKLLDGYAISTMYRLAVLAEQCLAPVFSIT